MEGPQLTTACEQQSEVSSAFDEEGEAIDQIDQLTTVMIERLQPLLKQEVPQPVSDQKQQEFESQIARTISERATTIRMTAGRLGDALSRLAI